VQSLRRCLNQLRPYYPVVDSHVVDHGAEVGSGHKVKFFAASQSVNTNIEARQVRMILKLEKNIQRYDLIIVDELGYIPLDRIGAEHLSGFFSQC